MVWFPPLRLRSRDTVRVQDALLCRVGGFSWHHRLFWLRNLLLRRLRYLVEYKPFSITPYTSLSFCSPAPLLAPRLEYMDRRRAGWVLAVDSGIQACGVVFRGKLIVAFSSRFVKEYIAMMLCDPR